MQVKRNRGGRPRKQVKKTEQLAVMCTPIDRLVIKAKAREANLTISEYLLHAGKGSPVKIKHIPREILQFTGRINHTAALLNQMARKLNCGLSLGEMERLLLVSCLETLQKLSSEIKSSLP
ncbi:hypothetical protein EGT74_22465 [Chitinophaga lutea]|uniref:Mobilization protein n=1 Tax=Chitinophaga lutea TaxID=2488634 RepID=A0A3N4PSJ1_9BACT|nr:hypothetical protein [Chitinophaga lutea]RPE09739.1 hypothetical protein EGT74_22465 [Chitinophaga lutea]